MRIVPPRGLRRALLSAALAFGFAATGLSAAQAKGFQPIDAYQQVHEMGRGVNVLGYDPFWGAGPARFQARHFKIIKAGGFDTIRVNLNAFPHMDARNRLDPAWLKKLDWVVDTATRDGLQVIVDEHNYNECGQDLASCRPKLIAFWTQVAARYRDKPNSVTFELLNEPNKQLDDATWNGLMHELLALVRQTNPTRNIVIGPAFWNNIHHLPQLDLPQDDRHIIVTVHYYLPMEFTHQGAKWNPSTYHLSGVTWGSPADYAELNKNFDEVQAWSQAHHRPILLGEFGAYDAGDMASRVRYTSAVARAAEKRGWAWTYWQFDGNFIVWDMKKNAWVAPIRKALVP